MLGVRQEKNSLIKTPMGELVGHFNFFTSTSDIRRSVYACAYISHGFFLTLPGLVSAFDELGYDVVEMVLADQEVWDRYKAAKWLTMRRWLEANPDDDFSAEVRSELTVSPKRHITYAREYFPDNTTFPLSPFKEAGTQLFQFWLRFLSPGEAYQHQRSALLLLGDGLLQS